MTLVELLVSLAIFSIASVGITVFILDSKKSALKVEQDVGEQLDRIVAERFILKDLRLADVSFNNVIAKDDNGNDFFTLIEDATDRDLILNSARKLTLSLEKNNSLLILRSEDKFGSGVAYSPELAYSTTDIPDDLMSEATLQYMGLNYRGWLQVNAPFILQPNRLVLLDVPARVRVVDVDGVDFNTPARSSIFVGKMVSGTGDVSKIDFNGRINFNHPAIKNQVNKNVDEYLRTLPAIGGGASIVRIRPIVAVEYLIVKQGDTSRADLVRRVYTDGKFDNAFTIATNVDKVIFARDSVRDALIKFNIVNAK